MSQSKRQTEPVVEGRIDDLVKGKASFLIRSRGMADFSAPAFNQTGAEISLSDSRHFFFGFSFGQFMQLLPDKFQRLLDFKSANIGAAKTIAAGPGVYR